MQLHFNMRMKPDARERNDLGRRKEETRIKVSAGWNRDEILLLKDARTMDDGQVANSGRVNQLRIEWSWFKEVFARNDGKLKTNAETSTQNFKKPNSKMFQDTALLRTDEYINYVIHQLSHIGGKKITLLSCSQNATRAPIYKEQY